MNKEFIYKNREWPTSIEKGEGANYKITLNGKPVDVTVKRRTENSCVFVHNNRLYITHIARDQSGRLLISYDGIYVSVLDKALAEGKEVERGAGGGNPNEIVSPMPGNVVKLTVKKGDRVSKGDTLIVIEAMKMETGYSAATDGVVEDVNAAVGSQIDGNQVLIRIKPEE
jgi:biotin carboxyl carrier protein